MVMARLHDVLVDVVQDLGDRAGRVTVLRKRPTNEKLEQDLEKQRSEMFHATREQQQDWHAKLELVKAANIKPSKSTVQQFWPTHMTGYDIFCGRCRHRAPYISCWTADYEPYVPCCARCRKPYWAAEIWKAARVVAASTGDAETVTAFLNKAAVEHCNV